MRSKTSSFNKEIIKQDFRNVGWISIIYFLGLFFIVPMQLFMEFGRDEPRIIDDRGLFGGIFAYELQSLFLIVMPVLMAVFLFRYLHVKGASDFAHSFPMKRGKLFHHHILSGIILLILPILLNYLVLMITAGITDVADYYTIGNASYWLWLFTTMSLLIFLAGVFVGTLTGISAVQGVLTFILLFLPVGLYGLIAFHLTAYIKGYSGDMVLDRSLQYFSPLVDLLEYRNYGPEKVSVPVEILSLFIYGGIAILFYFASVWLYKKRPLEAAGRALAVRALNPVFILGVTFCFALFGGMYFSVAQNTYSWMITGYFIGGTFGYAAASMLLQKTWRVFNFKNLKGWLGYGAAAGVLIAAIPLLWQNYESYVPEQNEVEKVYISSGYWEYQQLADQDLKIPYITSETAIQSTINLHEKLIKVSDPLKRGEDYFFFAYQLKDGSEVYRQYRIDEEKVRNERKTVYETEEYKSIQYPVFELKSSEINQVFLHSYSGGEDLYDPERISRFMEILKQDLEQLTYEEMIAPRGLNSGVTFTVDGTRDNPYYVQLYPSYERSMEWLKEEGLYDQVMIQPKDIQRAEVYRWPKDQDYLNSRARFIYDQMERDEVEPLEVMDHEQIDSLLRAQAHKEEGAYIVAFYFDKNDPEPYEVLSFDKGDAPDFIKEHFE
ncbi:DUF6449 domain-containing protein [Halobacillus litoralis]|uniref:DUF6449 domain-containing protein n=1 Tax=Halobacillus litoralis TaxID=45668 RepID=UPI001CFCD2E4|nr:DUF6449 domain-containing protein [Halobacillus litoralis]WLR48327.1 DUF6449 domain-containing protein [Halobacillus litoralis]